MSAHRARLVLVLLALALMSPTSPVVANMAAPLQPGTAIGEPQAALDGLVVENERLQIDLRPLALDPSHDDGQNEAFGRALISARYTVRNDSTERRITLEFAAHAGDTAQWTVTIDGRHIRAFHRLVEPGRYPTPTTTPGIDGAPLRYAAEATSILRFDAIIGPGRHTVDVEYVAKATRQIVDHPLVHWQIAYLLAPARSWPSFGSLDLAVVAPSSWQVATNLGLERKGELLAGRFDGIPADALMITARSIYQWWFPIVAWAPALVTLGVGAWGAWRLGRSLGRRLSRAEKGPIWALPAALGAGFVLGVAVPVAGLVGAVIEESLVGAGQGAWGDYSFFLVEVLLAIASFIGGLVLVQLSASMALNVSRRRYDARWADAYALPDDQAFPRAFHTNGTTHHEQQ